MICFRNHPHLGSQFLLTSNPIHTYHGKTLGPFLQGFPMHLAGAGIKAWLLLTSPLAGVPMVTQEGSLPDHARSHILILAIQGGRPGANPVRAVLPIAQKGKLSPMTKKRGGFPQGIQPGPRSPEARCNLLLCPGLWEGSRGL